MASVYRHSIWLTMLRAWWKASIYCSGKWQRRQCHKRHPNNQDRKCFLCPRSTRVKSRLLCSKRKFPFGVAIRIISLFRLAMCVLCVCVCCAYMANGHWTWKCCRRFASRRTHDTKGIEVKSYILHRLLSNFWKFFPSTTLLRRPVFPLQRALPYTHTHTHSIEHTAHGTGHVWGDDGDQRHWTVFFSHEMPVQGACMHYYVGCHDTWRANESRKGNSADAESKSRERGEGRGQGLEGTKVYYDIETNRKTRAQRKWS